MRISASEALDVLKNYSFCDTGMAYNGSCAEPAEASEVDEAELEVSKVELLS